MTILGKRPQLTLDELHQVRWLLGGVLTLLAVATVAYMEVEAWWLMALTAAVAAVTTLQPTLPARIPRLAHLLAFPCIAAFFAVDLWLRSELLPAMVRLDMLLLLYRSLVYRQRRDDLQVIVLGLFLVVVAGVLTVSLAFALQILVYTACALLFLLVLTLADGRDRPATATGAVADPKPSDGVAAPDVPPAWAVHASWGRLLRKVGDVLDGRVVLLGAGLFVGVIAASALLFLLIPRFQLDNGMFLDRFITKKARSGFTDSIRFGDVSEIQQDTGVALHVDVADSGQIPRAPYWRMLVLDDYSDGTFRMSPALQHASFEGRPHTGSTVYGQRLPRRSRGTWTVYLEPGISRYLPMLGQYRVVRFAEAQTFRPAPELALIALAKDPVTMVAYQVDGFDLSTPLADSPGRFYGERPLSKDTLQANFERERLHQLAQEAGGAAHTAAEFSTLVGGWLREHHAYSLSPRIPAGSGDPLVRWVDSREPGHCELFAGSFVLLARAAGYPARVVTGFRGGTWNAYVERSFTVRNSDAHAWAEIYDRDRGGWLRADPLELPTAEIGAGAAADATAGRLDRSWSARLDSLRVFWYRRVVSFDQEAQVQTLREAKQLAQSAIERFRLRLAHGAEAFRNWWHSPWSAGRVIRGLGILIAAAAATYLWRLMRTWVVRSAPWRRGHRREDPVRREASRWLRQLRQRERGREVPVVTQLERLRFGRRETWPEPTTVFRQARRTLAQDRRPR